MFSMSRGAIIKQIIALGTPIALMSVMGYLSSAIGILMLSHFGAMEVAASALATSTVMTVNAMVGTTMLSVSIRTSFYRGKKADDAVFAMILKAGLSLGFLVALVGSVIVWFGPQWLHLFHRNPALIARTVLYFHLSAVFLILVGWTSAWIQFLNGLGKTIIGTWASALRLPIAVAMMYIFIFGKFGMPQLQLGGLILAQLIGVVAILILLAVYTLRQSFAKQLFRANKGCGSKCKEMGALFKLGWPIGIQYGGELFAMTVAVYMIGAFGADALAAQQIVAQYSLIIIMLTLGISQAASILIAKVHGEQNLVLGHRIMAMSVWMMCITFIVFIVVVLLAGHEILSIFYNHNMAMNTYIQTLAYDLLWVAVFVLFFDALRNLFAFGLRAIGFPQSPMIIGLLCLWCISLPIAYVTGFHVLHNVVAFRLGFSSGFVVAAVWLWFMWYRKVEHRIAQG